MAGEVETNGAGPPSSRPIAVYGATGYTGRLASAELARRGAELVCVGRNEERLAVLAEELGARYEVAALDDPGALVAALSPCAAVISCAGPFVEHGEPVVRAAIESGTHYLDTTGEQPFIRRVFDVHGRAAERAGVALVSAMGFDYVPGDMLASLTAAGMGALEEVLLAYAVSSFGASRGTSASAIGMMSGGDVEWRDGALVDAPQSVGRGRFGFPAPLGEQAMVRYPAGEHVTVPRHVETRRVRTMLTASTVAPVQALAPLAPALMKPLLLALRTPARRAFEAAVSRLGEGPDPEARKRARFTIVCEARGPSGMRRGVLHGSDVYGLTGAITAEGALRFADPGFDRAGALAPSQALDPAGFLDALAPAGLTYEIDAR